ncbi:MAG: EscU/YscU/HrcU family type III secretion system export apparatus switch protein, partial [Clostridia bacterium]|nr:EscU/YscU/HrcU family type III secretion system export apparatus switch protein [Clostridia bacterium]
IGFISSTIQTGFLQVEDALKPDFNKLDPIKNFARIFSLRSLVEGLKAIFKLLIVGTVMYLLLRSEMQRVPYLVTYSLSEIFHYTGTIIVKLFLGIGVLMLVMAGADYFFQWWKLEREMMMTRQEIKDETKQREGDPLIKSRIRRIQREVANRRMMEAVPKADVIITNPTHIAVALRYGEDVPAPQLIAKGADLVAEKIKSIAREHNIPIVENKPLARTIYKTMKIGQIIPRELFVAVAEVLAYVYKLRKKVRV